jgi:hypothetical protein
VVGENEVNIYNAVLAYGSTPHTLIPNGPCNLCRRVEPRWIVLRVGSRPVAGVCVDDKRVPVVDGDVGDRHGDADDGCGWQERISTGMMLGTDGETAGHVVAT